MAAQTKTGEGKKEAYVTPEITKQPNLKEITQNLVASVSVPEEFDER